MPPAASIPDHLPLGIDERERYRRHLILPGVGTEGQERLKAARVLVVGAGGLGSPVALYLAAAGVGTIGLVDNDVVDLTNLQRQLLYGTRDVGRTKLDAARERLHDVNPHVRVVTHACWLTSANALDIVRDYEVVVDGTDNFATRYLVNDACVLLGIPNVHGSVFRFDGQASVFAAPDGPCYRCLYPEPPAPDTVPTCAEGGVFGVLPGLLGTIQATETIKLLLGFGDTLVGRLLVVDAQGMNFHALQVARDPLCPACGTRTITRLIDYDAFCGTPGLHADAEARVSEIAPAVLRAWLTDGAPLQLVDVREPHETATGSIDGAQAIPLGALGLRLDTLARDVRTVLVCKSGLRSARGARQLMAAGFTSVHSLAGGMMRWQEG